MPRSLLALILLFVCALATTASAQNAQRTAPTIRGIVLDLLTRTPVDVALVQLLGPGGGTFATATTSRDGRFQLNAPAAGSYRLRTTRIGYESADSTAVIVQGNDTTLVEIRISPSPVLLDSVLVVGRAEARTIGATQQLLHGRLLDDDTREPIVSGSIKLLRGESVVATTITNQYGLFRLRSPLPGSYTIRAERIGYATGESQPLHLMLRDTVRLDFFLSPSAVMLNPITVTASARPWANRYSVTGMDDFFKRMERWRNQGYYLQRDTLVWAAQRGLTTAFMIRELALQKARGCNDDGRTHFEEPRAQFWLNGSPLMVEGANERQQFEVLNDRFPPLSLEAVEVYFAPRIPGDLMNHPEFAATRFPCKIISLWSRRQLNKN